MLNASARNSVLLVGGMSTGQTYTFRSFHNTLGLQSETCKNHVEKYIQDPWHTIKTKLFNTMVVLVPTIRRW